MKKLLLAALLLTGCGITAPPRDAGQWTSTVLGVQITWRLNQATTLGGFTGVATSFPLGQSCVVDIEATARSGLTRIGAHEAGHCLQAAFLLPGISRPDLGPYFNDPGEGFAETYARAYLAACGDSLRPLGWVDRQEPTCTAPPDPHNLKGTE